MAWIQLALGNNIDRLLKRSISLHNRGQLNAASQIYRKILNLNPSHEQALHLLGVLSLELNDHREAIRLIKSAVLINKDNAEAHYNLGLSYQALGQQREALEHFTQASLLAPEFYEAFNCIGITFDQEGKYDEAILSYQQAVKIKTDYSEAFYNQAITYTKIGESRLALESYRNAIKANENYAKAYNNIGIILYESGDYAGSLESYERAVSIDPEFIEPYYNQAMVYFELKQYGLALNSIEQAVQLNPFYDYLLGTQLHIKQHICDWINFEFDIDRILSQVKLGKKVIKPFDSLSVIESPALQKQIAEIWVRSEYKRQQLATIQTQHPKNKKIRIAYFSADFRDHAVSRLIVELFELHDREKFEVIGFTFKSQKNNNSSFQTRIISAFNEFYDVQEMSDDQIVKLVRSLSIDIAIDLGGYTTNNRFGIFMSRVSPIQISYLGYLGTLGSNVIDYLIADRTLVPNHSISDFSENIIYLPNYQINSSREDFSEVVVSREDLDLPETGFIFCCFNNSYKITPKIFYVWMNILISVPGSVLYLYADNPIVESNLKKEARLLEVDPSRIIFTRRSSLSDYFLKYKAVDLFLDTSPYNAGTTSSDALWMGVPVITCIGETFAGRMAASNLTAIDMDELIVSNLEEYQTLAVLLATNPILYGQLKQKLMSNINTSKLFDSDLFTKNIEAVYTMVYAKNKKGLRA